MRSMRLGLAVLPPVGVRRALVAIQQHLGSLHEARGVQWVEEENLHVGLRDYGAVVMEEGEEENLIDTLKKRAGQLNQFVLRLDHVAVAPSWNKPRHLSVRARTTKKKVMRDAASWMVLPRLEQDLIMRGGREQALEIPSGPFATATASPALLLGGWTDIYIPPLKGTTFRHVCSGYTDVGSFLVDRLHLVKQELADDTRLLPRVTSLAELTLSPTPVPNPMTVPMKNN